MGRRREIVLVGLVLAAASACGPADDRADGHRDVVFVGSASGLTALRATDGAVLVGAPGGIASRDGALVFRATQSVSATRVEALESSTGAARWSRLVDPGLTLAAATERGDAVVLAPLDGVMEPAMDHGYLAAPRENTSLVVLKDGGRVTQRLDLPGNLQPEAFSADGQSVFVLEYTPATAPERYRVRRLDLLNATVNDVYSPDKDLQTDMRGTARTQVFSPDGRRLYTLYNLDGQRAFVHVLNLDEQWAHCVDLTGPIGLGPDGSTALAISPDGNRVYVADRSVGRVAEIDTRALAVTRTAEIPTATVASRAVATTSAHGDRLYVGDATALYSIDTATLELAADRLPVAGPVAGLQVGRGEIWIARDDRLDVVRDGRIVRTVRVPGLTGIDRLGLSSPVLAAERRTLQCAC
jgi:DNA-binding beta-propeller fold protein YncE